jgi:ceramide glucosyltransferase
VLRFDDTIPVRCPRVNASVPIPKFASVCSDLWRRQTRWARLRRASFLHLFLPEGLSGALLPALALAFVAGSAGWPVFASLGAFAALWYGAEMALAHAAGGICRRSLR